MNVTFVSGEVVASGIKTFWFKPERPVDYIAGQFTELYLPHEADERGIRRWFTLSSSPTEELVSITTKFLPERGSTFKQQLTDMQPGTQLKLADPMGDFVLPKDPTIPLIFVATGLGITPVRSMIKWLMDQKEPRQIQLIYAVSKVDDLAFVPLFESYELDLTTLVKNPSPDCGGDVGRLDPERIAQLAHTHPEALLYISGPEIVTETLYKALRANNIPEERLVTDYFPGYVQV